MSYRDLRSKTMDVQVTLNCEVEYRVDRGNAEQGQGATVEIEHVWMREDWDDETDLVDEISDSEKEALAEVILGDWLEGEPRDE
jgi:hypothetical protein